MDSLAQTWTWAIVLLFFIWPDLLYPTQFHFLPKNSFCSKINVTVGSCMPFDFIGAHHPKRAGLIDWNCQQDDNILWGCVAVLQDAVNFKPATYNNTAFLIEFIVNGSTWHPSSILDAPPMWLLPQPQFLLGSGNTIFCFFSFKFRVEKASH